MWCVRACGLDSSVGYFNVKTYDIWGKCDNKEGEFNWALMFPRISRYKRSSDIREVKAYLSSDMAFINKCQRENY